MTTRDDVGAELDAELEAARRWQPPEPTHPITDESPTHALQFP